MMYSGYCLEILCIFLIPCKFSGILCYNIFDVILFQLIYTKIYQVHINPDPFMVGLWHEATNNSKGEVGQETILETREFIM